MHYRTLRQLLGTGALCVGALAALCGCTDSSYDLDKIDLTMGLGSDGLTLKMGQTEADSLKDMLSTDENVKLDKDNLYYMVNSSASDQTFSVRKTDPAHIGNQTIRTASRVIDYAQAGGRGGAPVTVTAGHTLSGQAVGRPVEVTINVTGVNDDIREMHAATLTTQAYGRREARAALKFNLVKSAGVSLSISELRNFSIQLPEYLKITSVSEGWTVEGHTIRATRIADPTDKICEVTFSDVDLTKGAITGEGADRRFDMAGTTTVATMEGQVVYRADRTFAMGQSDYADLEVYLDFETGQTMYVYSATGIFDPEINTVVDPIDVVDNLPDFLKDNEVKVSTTNTTVKFTGNTRTAPFNILVGADLTAVKEGTDAFTQTVSLRDGQIGKGQADATTYFYEGSAPYDPNSVSPTADKHQTEGLGSLVERIPDRIDIDMNGRKVRLKQEQTTAVLGKTYEVEGKLTIYAPFKFDKGLTIVYNDSTDSFNDDVKDYSAEGLQINGNAVTTIPLDLTGTVTAVDIDGRALSGVKFNEITIAASTDGLTAASTPIELKATLSDPSDLRKIDKLKIRIRAKNERELNGGEHAIYSTQYLKFQDLKLRLTGKVIGDFN